MKRLLSSALLLLALLAVGCSRIKTVPLNEVHMSGSAFLSTTATVKAGQPVKFIDNADGATHILVVGTNGLFAADPDAPTQLNTDTGTTINAGQENDIVFPKAGTFAVTCKIHPAMQLAVTVTP